MSKTYSQLTPVEKAQADSVTAIYSEAQELLARLDALPVIDERSETERHHARTFIASALIALNRLFCQAFLSEAAQEDA